MIVQKYEVLGTEEQRRLYAYDIMIREDKERELNDWATVIKKYRLGGCP